MEPVLIEYHQEVDKITSQMNFLDGILIPGGETLFEMETFKHKKRKYFRVRKNAEHKYLDRITSILQKAKDINNEGRVFVVYAICLGFQAILITESFFNIRIAHVG